MVGRARVPELTTRLRRYRKTMRMTQQEVADRIGVQRSTYSRYEEGSNHPSWKVLMKLADLYEVSMDELVGREVKNEEDPAAETTERNARQEEAVREQAASPEEAVPSKESGERRPEQREKALTARTAVGAEEIQRILSLFWTANDYAREAALLILENGQRDADAN